MSYWRHLVELNDTLKGTEKLFKMSSILLRLHANVNCLKLKVIILQCSPAFLETSYQRGYRHNTTTLLISSVVLLIIAFSVFVGYKSANVIF